MLFGWEKENSMCRRNVLEDVHAKGVTTLLKCYPFGFRFGFGSKIG
jgi:hypothetical protein